MSGCNAMVYLLALRLNPSLLPVFIEMILLIKKPKSGAGPLAQS